MNTLNMFPVLIKIDTPSLVPPNQDILSESFVRVLLVLGQRVRSAFDKDVVDHG